MSELALTRAQRRALEVVRRQQDLGALLGDFPSLPGNPVGWRHPEPTINFHPDRYTADGHTVAEGLLADGRYRNQFEVGITNGHLSAFPGGLRDRREAEMFGGVYQLDNVRRTDRPKYGSLGPAQGPFGGWPRFGSCHLVLAPAVLDRATVSLGDSIYGPRWLGLACDVGDAARAGDLTGRAQPSDPTLDGVFELQIHGPVRLRQDATALVIDPSFQGTKLENVLVEIGERYDLAVIWGPPVRRSPLAWAAREWQDIVMRLLSEQDTLGAPCHAEWVGRAVHELQLNPPRALLGENSPEEIGKFLWHSIFEERVLAASGQA